MTEMAYDNGIRFDRLEGTDNGQVYVNVLSREGDPLEYTIPLWKANWEYKRRYSPAIAAMMDSWDGGDPWGSANEMAFAVSEVARAMGESVPQALLSYRPSPIAPSYTLDELANVGPDDDVSFLTTELADAVRDGRVEASDLIFAARVLNRYLNMLDNAGQSY